MEQAQALLSDTAAVSLCYAVALLALAAMAVQAAFRYLRANRG